MVDEEKQNVTDSPKKSANNTKNFTSCPHYKNNEREEYMNSLKLWIYEARIWQNAAMHFPYYMMGYQHNAPSLSISNNNGNQPQPNINPRNIRQFFQPADVRRGPPITLSPTEGLEFIIPPVWKRVLAEIVDFSILFVAKLIMTLIVLEILDKSDWGIFNLSSNVLEFTLDSELANGLLVLEGLHRVLVCIYEIYWLHGTTAFPFGCATPGKALLGLTVVVATKIKNMEPNNPNGSKVLIYPGQDLGYIVAAGRAFIKNILLALMFPFCFAIFIFQFNRTGYDIMCNTIVVEYDPDPPKRTWL